MENTFIQFKHTIGLQEAREAARDADATLQAIANGSKLSNLKVEDVAKLIEWTLNQSRSK